MRVAASLIALIAVSLAGTQALAQSIDKAVQATAGSKTQGSTKASTAAQARPPATPAAPAANARAAGEAGKAKIEGVSTQRSTPADGKKDGDCHSQASDA